MTDKMRVEIKGDLELNTYFKKMSNVGNTSEFKQAFIDSSILVESKAKKHLRKMIYDKPITWYKREAGRGGLINRTLATRKIVKRGKTFITSVISKLFYAKYVHFGTGIHAKDGKGRKTAWWFKDDDGFFHKTIGVRPKPYFTKAVQDSKKVVLQRMSKFFK